MNVTLTTTEEGLTQSVTELLQRFSVGDRQAADQALQQLMPLLRKAAACRLRKDGRSPELTPTELINETWARHLGRGHWTVNNREHFMALASSAMRLVLLDLARRRIAQRRSAGNSTLSLSEGQACLNDGASPDQIVELNRLMEYLEQFDPATAQVVDMHYFAGFSLQEISEVTHLSLRQVRHRWEKGRNWLCRRLAPAG